ncbi:MAG: NAD(P)/FAD-dependent oxidoreductase, partial [Planctomycetaceae bacterium]
TVDRAGRVIVEPDLSLPGHPHLFVIGDLANYSHQDARPLPGVAPVAIQQGRYVARLIAARLRGETLEPFRYKDRGNLAVIGRRRAVAQLGRWKFGGFVAWLIWLLVHLMLLVQYQNRLLVLTQWAWNYVTFNRAARLITGKILPVIRPTVSVPPAATSIGDNPPAPATTDGSARPAP